MSFHEKSYLEAAKAVALLINDLILTNINFIFRSLRRFDESALSRVLAILLAITLLGTLLTLDATANIVPTDRPFAAATEVNPSSSRSEEEPMGLHEATLAYAGIALDEKHKARARRKVKNMGIQRWVDEVNTPRRGERRHLIEEEEAERWLRLNTLAARI